MNETTENAMDALILMMNQAVQRANSRDVFASDPGLTRERGDLKPEIASSRRHICRPSSQRRVTNIFK